jgi:hypothetical protein
MQRERCAGDIWLGVFAVVTRLKRRRGGDDAGGVVAGCIGWLAAPARQHRARRQRGMARWRRAETAAQRRRWRRARQRTLALRAPLRRSTITTARCALPRAAPAPLRAAARLLPAAFA